MNKWIGIGRLTRDPEVRYSQGPEPIAIARFSLAVDRRVKTEGQQVDFINIVCFGKSAESAEKYLKKGTKILIEGRIQTGSYTKDGRKVYTTEIVLESWEFAESKNTDTSKEQDYYKDGFTSCEEGLPFS